MVHLTRLLVGILGLLLILSPVALAVCLVYSFVLDGLEILKIVSGFLVLLGVMLFAYALGQDVLK